MSDEKRGEVTVRIAANAPVTLHAAVLVDGHELMALQPATLLGDTDVMEIRLPESLICQ